MSSVAWLFSAWMFYSSSSNAELKSMNDQELSHYSGQAVIQIDQAHDQVQNLDFTRVKFGLDIKANITADKVELGKYDRNSQFDSDISVEKLSLGTINSNGTLSPFEIKDPFFDIAIDADTNDFKGFKLGFGTVKGDVVVDIGTLSGNFYIDIWDNSNSFGSTVSNLLDKLNYTNAATGFDSVIGYVAEGALWAANLGTPLPMYAPAQLVDAYGNSTLIRSQMAGIPNGGAIQLYNLHFGLEVVVGALHAIPSLSLYGWQGLGAKCTFCQNYIPSLGPIFGEVANATIPQALTNVLGLECHGDGVFCGTLNVKSGNCSVLLTTPVCLGLSDYRTLPIGKFNGAGQELSPADGVFLSLQGSNIIWPKLLSNTETANNIYNAYIAAGYSKSEAKNKVLSELRGTINTPNSDWAEVASGYAVNVPQDTVTVNFTQASTNISRVRSKYIDDYY